jgi:hypothetical protein
MADRPPSQRFKTDMPQIPGISAQPPRTQPGFKPVRLIGFLAGLIFCLLWVRWVMLPKPAVAPAPAPTPKIELPAPVADPNAALPHATETQPAVATVAEMAKPWSYKEFFYKNRLSGENVPAVLVRLPSGAASQRTGYWAFSLNAPFGNCRLEYVREMERLKTDYGFVGAKHPMVGNPCSRTLFDPLKMMSIPGGVWVRGAIAQGSDLRPPLGIEVEIRSGEILANRME